MDLEELIKQKENPKLDFKKQWYWNENTSPDKLESLWGECIKDILALCNTIFIEHSTYFDLSSI